MNTTNQEVGRWSRHHIECLGCGTTRQKHYAGGLCHKCYQRERYQDNKTYWQERYKDRAAREVIPSSDLTDDLV